MGTEQEVELPVVRGRSRTCALCGEGIASLSYVHQEFRHGSGGDAADIRALVPVWTCNSCGAEFLDQEGEAAKHAAICRHLERLTPEEIRAIRSSAELSQRDFAKALKVGVASVKRWELGLVIQTQAADESIRRFSAEHRASIARTPRFNTAFAPAIIEAAGRFRLRGGYASELVPA